MDHTTPFPHTNKTAADQVNNALRAIAKNTSVTTFVGRGPTNDKSSIDGPRSVATLNGPWGLDIDAATDTLYFTEYGGLTVRSCTSEGFVTTLAGTAGWSGTNSWGAEDDGGSAINALLSLPSTIAFDSRTRAVVFNDVNKAAIRRIDLTTGIISLVAGVYGVYIAPNSPDGSIANRSPISGETYGLAFRPSDGALIFVDAKWRLIRAIVNGVFVTIAGTGAIGTGGNGGPASLATFEYPYG